MKHDKEYVQQIVNIRENDQILCVCIFIYSAVIKIIQPHPVRCAVVQCCCTDEICIDNNYE